MDKFSLKDLVKEEVEATAPKTTLWEPISAETKEPVNEYSAKTSRIGSLSDLNEDLKETKTVVKSGWTPIVQKVEEKPKVSFPTAKPPSGFKGLKDVYKEELINVVTANPTTLYERIELPPVVVYKKSAEEERDELVQSFTEQIKVKEQNRVIEPARVEPVQEPESVAEEAIAEPITEEASKEKTLIDKASEFITKELKIEENSFQQPDVQPTAQNFKDITRKVKHLEDWLSKVSLAGPGGGETNLRYLDDVDRDSIVNGYVLSYDEVTSKFTFVSPTAGSFTPTDVTQVFAEVKNADSVTITKGQPVYLFAAVGNRASVKLANNSGDATSAKTLGLVYSSSIAPGGTGLIITQGVVSGVNTQAYNEGDTLYLGNTAGSLTSVKPYAPNHLVYIGVVERANQGQGQIYVRPQNGYELNEIHDVSINHTVPLSNNDILVWNSASNLWINRPVSFLNQTTSNIIEGSNLYYSNSRVYSNVISLGYITSSSLTGYATNAQLSSYATTSNLTLKANVVDLTTANVNELTNLYFTNARAVAAVTAAGITSLNNGSYALTLNSDGTVNITGNIFDTGTNPAILWSNDAVTNYWRSPTGGGPGQPLNSSIRVNSSGATITLDTGVLGLGSSISWLYDHSGNITFPDSTVQTTAFNNTAVYSNVITLGYITSSALSGYAKTANLTTANVTELTNLYYTNARVVSALSTNTLGNITTGNVVVTGSGNYNSVEVSSTYGGVNITNSRGNMLIGNNTRDGVARYALNTANGMYSGVQVQRAGTEKWFYGANQTEDFVVRADNTTDILTINANGTITITGSITGYATTAQLVGYATNAQLATYATNAQLASYATNAQLTSYATTTNVALKANIVDLTTANVTEVTNLYFTNARSYANVLTLGYAKTANLTTANVTEVTNLYFTNARATAAVTNTLLSNITIGGQSNVVYTPGTTNGVALNITAANTKGGTGYADFLQVTNTSGGAVSPTKWLRLNNTGELQIINSGYTAQLLVLSDSGDLTVLGNITSSGNKSGYSSGRPGFRVIGSGSTSWSTTVNTVDILTVVNLQRIIIKDRI